jgi:signal transduction histidine kinase
MEGGDVSERPSTTNRDVQRTGRPWRRFRDLPIWSKLGMIMIVPTLATIVVGTNGLIGQIDTASSADRARVLANLSDVAGELVHDLQNERAAAVLLLGAGAEQAEDRSVAFRDAQPAVDTAERQFLRESDTLAEVPASFRELLGDVRGQLSLLPQTRGQVAAGEIGLTDAGASYGELAASLINLRDSSAQLVGDTELGDRMRAAAAISRAKEFLSQQRVIGHEVLIRDAYQPSLRSAFIAAQAGYENFLQIFGAAASGPEQAMLDQALEGTDVRQSQLYQDYLESLEGEDLGTPPWDAESWDAVMSTHADLVRELERELDRVIVVDATALRNAVTRQVLVEAGALLAVVLLAFLLAWLVARSMARSLRDLRQGALAVAQHGLPQAVARLRDPALSTQLSPAQVASQIAEPLPVRSKDEFGQVAEAFNAVHLEAVRTAAEQAQLRSSVATMFVNLARRSQILVDRLIGHLDRLERGEEDPDRLAELFQLDHLATRMRRNDENLLVLAGADSTRVQRDPASLMDVLRAAQSEVEHYTRIEFGVVDRDLEVAAHAVNDLVHLVAELFDNATVFSPPESPVVVEARRVGDRAVLYVEDRGLGLSPQQLAEINERLATPPMVDVAVSRMMGLVVVARLAARHGVSVELRPAAERGTVADVTLPASVLVPRALGSRPTEPAAVRLEPVRPLPPGERLALESGRPGPDRLADARAGRGRPQPPFEPPSFAQPPPFGPPAPSAQPAGDGAVRSPGRSMPAWSDLTGATGSNGPTGPNGADSALAAPTAAPLPRRRPGAGISGEPDPPASQPPVPGPRAAPPGEPRSASPPAGGGTRPDPPAIGQPAPPPWPPVAPATATPVPAETGVANPEPPAPVRPVPATTSARPAGAGAPGPGGGGGPGSLSGPGSGRSPVDGRSSRSLAGGTGPAPTAEETMELPIFRELESAWFRARRPIRPPGAPGDGAAEAGGAAAGGAEAAEFASVSASPRAARVPSDPPPGPAGTTAGSAVGGEAVRGAGAPEGAGAVATEGWRTAADDGWRAASSAAEAVVQETTAAGLPKRRPMAQLVPGGVEREPTSAQHRSPEAVRGLLSAYHRGVQRGREQSTDQDTAPSSGSPSTPAGKERGT